jgi:hypothetical protein
MKRTAKRPSGKKQLLPEDLLWADGGHASDVALTALADGQSAILPATVLAHVERCTTCSAHLGNAALLSLYAQREIVTLQAKRPVPRLPVILGLVVAVLGFVPTLLDPSTPGAGRLFVTRDLPLYASGLRTLAHRLFQPGSQTGLYLTYGGAFLLFVLAAFAIRLLPKKETPR